MSTIKVHSLSTFSTMALYLILLTVIIEYSLASTEQCVSSPGSSIDLSLRSHKNASGHWIITVDTGRYTKKDNPREFSVNVQHGTKICGRNDIEEHVSMAFVYSSLHDTSMPGAIEPSTTRPTITTTSTTTTLPTSTTNTSNTTTAPTIATTTISTNTPKSCPHSGYQLYPGFNCYKAFPSECEMKTWSEAREQCMSDGGDLIVMESVRERVDVFIPQGGNEWTTVKGEPALSTWWAAGYPKKNAAKKCAQAHSTGLLFNLNYCTATRPFICEISL